MVIPTPINRKLRAVPIGADHGVQFTAHEVPHEVRDPVQRDWNARQWRDLQNYCRALEEALRLLDTRLAAAEAIIEADTWDRA